jgi:hypothetical protein
MLPDYEEGIELWKAGDPEEARDALRYALQGCHDNMWIHVALGRIAIDEFKDPSLAQGHFGYAVELVCRSIPAGFSGSLPIERGANRPLFEAVEGLIECLQALGKPDEAERVRAMAARLVGGSPPAQKLVPPTTAHPRIEGPA